MVKMNLKKSALQLHHTWKNKFTCDQCEHLKSLFLEASFILWILFSKRKKAWSKFILKSCLSTERAGIRTPDNLIKSQVLYHLSYTPLFLSQGKCPEPESNQWHEDFQSSALPTELSGHTHNIMCELRGQDLNLRPSGYEPDELPDCSTPRY